MFTKMGIKNAHPGKFFSQTGCNSVSNRNNFPCLRGKKPQIVGHVSIGMEHFEEWHLFQVWPMLLMLQSYFQLFNTINKKEA